MKNASITKQTFGFTLIELMVVIVIVAILASVALPSYQSQIRKSHRKEAIAMIHSLQGRLERARSSLMSYASFNGFTSTEFSHYQYSIAAPGDSYVITATPVNNQTKDVCGIIVYSSTNEWTFDGGAADEDNCL